MGTHASGLASGGRSGRVDDLADFIEGWMTGAQAAAFMQALVNANEAQVAVPHDGRIWAAVRNFCRTSLSADERHRYLCVLLSRWNAGQPLVRKELVAEVKFQTRSRQ
jgi:hypothetical protein